MVDLVVVSGKAKKEGEAPLKVVSGWSYLTKS